MQAGIWPELPDIAAYLSSLVTRIVGQPLERIRLANTFLLRTMQPPIEAIEGHMARSLRRIGKRIGDKAYDSDKLDELREDYGVELIAPNRRNRGTTQDRRKLRRYKKRWAAGEGWQ